MVAGGERRYKEVVGRAWSGRSDRAYRGGGNARGGGDWRAHGGRSGRGHVGSRRVHVGTPRYHGGGASDYDYSGGTWCREPIVVYRHPRPRSHVSIRLGVGLPYYCPPAYRQRVDPYPIEEDQSPSIDVENLPPAGCYYHDPFCDEEFSDLDGYTDHIDQEDHEKTIDIVERDSGRRVRTLEFVDGYWGVQN